MNEIASIIAELTILRNKNIKDMENINQRMKEIDAETNENIRDQRKQHYSHRADLIERNEKKKCAESSRLYKELEKKSFSGPFFDSLLDILKNFQGCFYFIFQSPHPLIRYNSNIVLRSHEHMSQPNQINSRSHQGPE